MSITICPLSTASSILPIFTSDLDRRAVPGLLDVGYGQHAKSAGLMPEGPPRSTRKRRERRHHFDLIQRQRAFRIVDETLAGRPRRAALWISIARICPVVCGLRPANPLLAISRVGLHIDLFEACSAFTRVAACTLARSPIVAAIRRLQPFRYLHDCSDCFRLERIAGWASHPLESAALSRRTP